MIRLSALNVDSSEESEPERTQESIKQAQEAEALGLYNKALQHQEAGDSVRAEQTYNLLLESHLVKEAPVPEEDEGLHKPGQVLKYSAYKNLAVLAENRGDWEKATDAYLEAVLLDDSDVTVWYHIGTVAIKSSNLGLARQAFQEGLRCNPKHWLCLSQLCSVLYAIGDYATCLGVISEALDRDEHFIKGLALRDKIFSEEPYLQRDYQYLRSLFVNTVDDEYTEEAKQHVKEALHLREERLRVIETHRKEPAPLEPVKPLTSYTWAALGECFVALYDHLTSPDDPKSLARRINLESYYKAIVTPDISMPHKASLAKLSDQTPASNFSTEGFQVYKATGNPADNEDKLPKKTAKRKKPPPSGMDTEFPPKRRSARVRTSKKKEEEVNYRELIQSFLPFSLRPGVGGGDDESSQDSMGDVASNSERSQLGADGKSNDLGRTGAYEGVISGEAETLDILTFVKENMNNSGMINLMVRYGICLAAQRNKQWPTALADVYLKVYTRVRKHLTLPPEFHRDNDEVYAGKLAKVILVATELTLEKLLTAKSKSSSSLSPASSPRGGGTGVSPIRVGPGFSSKYLVTDVEYLYCISLDRSIHGDSWLEMTIRVNWAKARYLMLQGQMEIAMIYLDRCTKLLAVEVSPLDEPITVKLVNCKIDSDITLEHVQKKLESLQRCQSLEEVHRLYEQGNYEDVIQLLMPTLNQPQPKTKISELGMSIPERPAQLLLLQDSLIRLGEYKKCLMCTEVALCEAVSQMTPCEAWSTTLSRLFQCINTCITHSKAILDGISQDKLTSLTLNIIKVIEASIYSSDNSLEPPLATAYPWTLLYKIIKHRDKDVEPMYKVITTPAVTSSAAATNTDSNMEISSVAGEPPSIPASLLFMRTAHDQLGRRGWCCNNDGIFLLLYVEALTAELAISHTPNREELVRDLEQCFLCLYGHPSKKAKARGLLEHNSCQIPLTWQNSAVVFNYFKPPELPTFDSKTNTISTEVQNLMRRITLVVPQQELEDIPFDNVQAFIEGTSDEVPKLPEKSVSVKRPVVDELFYLLADFYFKNKEFSKALKFYTHDVCVQPDRSDSWAAMALARKSRLENKLNACEPKSEGPIQKHSVAALRCFNRAMETDSTNSSILEEYGSLCYFLHSHASRQLKQFEEMDASVDTRSSLLQRKQDMLLLSEKCFTHALGMEDSEAWLHHYMLGKIAEKLKKQPQIYLQQYEKSTKYLDEDISSYPRKIPFYSPPEHVLEALEVYYRIHVSILKLLLNKTPDVELSLLEEHIERAAKGPFYQPEHDTEGSHVSRSESINSESSEVDQENSNLEIPRAAAKKETDLPTITEQPDRLDTGPEYPNTVQDHPITGQDRPNPGPERPINVPDVPITGQDRPNTGPDGLNTAPDPPKTPDNTRASASASPPAKECVLAAVDMDTEKPIDMEICAGQAIPASSDALATDVSMETEDGTANPKADVEMDAPVESNNDLKQDVAQSSKTSEDECKSEEPFEIKEGQNADKVESKESRQEQAKGREEEASKTHIGDAKQGENEDLDSNKLNAGTKISEEQEQMIVDSHAPQTNDKDVSESSANLEQVMTLPLTAEEKARRQLLLARCIRALEHCLKRFPQHHKSRYRLAYVAFYSPPHKDLAYCRDLLLGSTNTKPKPGRPVHQGLFNANSKTNMFSSFWRIPEEDIDRPGSFCTHTYKSVDLLLRVLRELNEWDTLLQVSTLLYRTPEAGKKFLRDNERHFQARSAVEFSVNIMTERVQNQDPKDGKAVLTQLVLDTYECWKVAQKYEKFAKMSENLVAKAYEMLKSSGLVSDDLSDSSSLLEQALRFCQQTAKPQATPQSCSSSAVHSQESSLDSHPFPEQDISKTKGQDQETGKIKGEKECLFPDQETDKIKGEKECLFSDQETDKIKGEKECLFPDQETDKTKERKEVSSDQETGKIKGQEEVSSDQETGNTKGEKERFFSDQETGKIKGRKDSSFSDQNTDIAVLSFEQGTCSKPKELKDNAEVKRVADFPNEPQQSMDIEYGNSTEVTPTNVLSEEPGCQKDPQTANKLAPSSVISFDASKSGNFVEGSDPLLNSPRSVAQESSSKLPRYTEGISASPDSDAIKRGHSNSNEALELSLKPESTLLIPSVETTSILQTPCKKTSSTSTSSFVEKTTQSDDKLDVTTPSPVLPALSLADQFSHTPNMETFLSQAKNTSSTIISGPSTEVVSIATSENNQLSTMETEQTRVSQKPETSKIVEKETLVATAPGVSEYKEPAVLVSSQSPVEGRQPDDKMSMQTEVAPTSADQSLIDKTIAKESLEKEDNLGRNV